MNGDWSFQAEKKKKILAIKIPSKTFPQTKLSHYFIRHIDYRNIDQSFPNWGPETARESMKTF